MASGMDGSMSPKMGGAFSLMSVDRGSPACGQGHVEGCAPSVPEAAGDWALVGRRRWLLRRESPDSRVQE